MHFADNRTLVENYEKIAKIKPIHDYLSQRFSLLYTPKRDISIDQSLLLWKGRLSWKQYIPKKCSHCGMKSFVLCEASSGYKWHSVLYSSKELTENLDTVYGNFEYVKSKIILSLMDELLDKGYHLFIDNWYTSFEIAHTLPHHETDIIGTLRKDHKNLPHIIKTRLNVAEHVIQYEKNANLMRTHWKHKKDVYMLSSCTEEGEIELMRAGKPKQIPNVVHIYNNSMGGVDRADQMLTFYSTERKHVKKWYKKYFHHLFSQSVLNTFISPKEKEMIKPA